VRASKLTGSGEESGGFGSSVALSADGNVGLIGGTLAWVFTRSGAEWAQQGEGITSCEGTGLVAMSADGAVKLIGGRVLVSPPRPTPCVTGVLRPNTGFAEGGTLVTISGLNFTGVTAITFGSASAATFTVHSATSLTAVSPPGSGIVHVTVTTAEGTSPSISADRFVYLQGPEYGRCLKAPGFGKYASGGCTVLGGGFYEWLPAFEGEGEASLGGTALRKTHFAK
jgi:IPT/TIG domain-containing protein